jgi:hypothetical protein
LAPTHDSLRSVLLELNARRQRVRWRAAFRVRRCRNPVYCNRNQSLWITCWLKARRGRGCEARRTCGTFTQGCAKRMQSVPPSKIMLRKNRPATGTTLSRYLTNAATSIWRSWKILLRLSSYDRCSGIRTLVTMPH